MLRRGDAGHFLVGLADLDLFLDPFNAGQLLSKSDCRRLARNMFGPELNWSDEYLAPCPRKQVLYRMLNNLRQIYLSRRDFGRHGAIVERMLLVAPAATSLYLELAQSQVHQGDLEGALRSLELLKNGSPSPRESQAADELIEILMRGRPR